MKKDNYIYCIYNKTNNHKYIGRTNNIEVRKKRHFSELKNQTHHCIFLQRAYNKYGKDNFEFKILCNNLTLEEAKKLEQKLLNEENNLYNVSKESSGGDLLSKHPDKEEIICKIKNSMIKRYNNMSEEDRKKIGEKIKGENNPNYKNRGENSPLYKKPLSSTHKQNISNSLKGRKLSQKHIEKMKLTKLKNKKEPWNKGKKLNPLSDEHKKKLSDKLKGKPPTNNRKVYCEGKTFNSVAESAKFYNISSSGMIIRLKSKSERFKDFYYID